MFSMLRTLWDKVSGWLFGTSGGAIVRAAVGQLIQVVGAAVASTLLVQAEGRAREIETRYGPGTGTVKAKELGGFISATASQAGYQLGTQLINMIIEVVVAAMQQRTGAAR